MAGCGPALRYPNASRQSVAEEEARSRDRAANLERERLTRLYRVYAVLRTANADLCGEDLVPVVGLMMVDPTMGANAEQREVQFGLKADTVIIDVVPQFSCGVEEQGYRASEVAQYLRCHPSNISRAVQKEQS